MFDEQYAYIIKLIARSLDAAKQGRYAYVSIQYETDREDVSVTFRSDKGKEEIEINNEEDEH